MKKYLSVILVLFALSACDKSLDQPELKFETVGLIDEIKISGVETGYSEITEVAFVARFHGFGNHSSTLDTDGKDTRVMLKVPFDAKNTTLILQKGWNIVIEKREYIGDAQTCSVTNLMPSGMKWKQDM